MTTSIVLWGLPGAGKTWFIKAFIQRIKVLNRSLEKAQSFKLTLEDPRRLESATRVNDPEVRATQEQEIRPYIFIRESHSSLDEPDLAFEVSASCHAIELVDDAGQNVSGLTTAKDEDIGMAERKLQKAECIILLLDEGTNVGAAGEIDVDQSKNSVNSVVSRIKYLRSLLLDHPLDKPRYIAACVTKTDRLGKRLEDSADPESLIIGKFGRAVGNNIINLLNEFRTEDGHNVKFFANSALGYVKNGGIYVTNLSQDGNGLADTSQWEPVKVEEPFFWIFSHLEQERLSNSVNELPFLFRLKWPYGAEAVLAARKKAYISYDDLLHTEMMVRRGK